jgi:hypothetical protein
MDHIIISKYKVDIWDLKNSKKIYLAHNKFFILRSLSIRRTIQNNPISPNNGPTKNFLKQNLNIYA